MLALTVLMWCCCSVRYEKHDKYDHDRHYKKDSYDSGYSGDSSHSSGDSGYYHKDEGYYPEHLPHDPWTGVVRLPCKEPWKWPPQWENYLCLKPKTGRACAQLCGFAFLEPRWYRHCIGQQC